MSDHPPELQKPRRERAFTVAELRQAVSARHKMLCGTKPADEAVELIRAEYAADLDSSVRFVEWLRGGAVDAPATRGDTVERRHIVADPETGDEREVETEPGSIPPRPR